MKYVVETTMWKNGCAFACVAELLMTKISLLGSPAISALPNYQRLLKAFAYIYGKKDLSWNAIQNAGTIFNHPADQQILWVAPLRALLEQVLLENVAYRDQFHITFITILRSVVLNNQSVTENEYLSIYNSNKSFFEQARQIYQNTKEEDRGALELEIFAGDKLAIFWEKVGYINYCHYIGQYQTESPMITAEELSILCETLHVKLAVFDLQMIDNKLEVSPISNGAAKGYLGENVIGQLEVICHGLHWQPLVTAEVAYLKKIFWHYSKQRLNVDMSMQQVAIAVNKVMNLPSQESITIEEILTAVTEQDVNQLALILTTLPLGMGANISLRKTIKEALDQQDHPVILTFYKFNAECRQYIIQLLCQEEYQKYFSLLRDHNPLIKFATTPTRWETDLQELLPPSQLPSKSNPVARMIRSKSEAAVIEFLQNKGNIYRANKYGVTGLHQLLEHSKTQVIQWLFNHESKLSIAQYQEKESHLFHCSRFTLKDNEGNTPLHYLARQSKSSMLPLMLNTLARSSSAQNNLLIQNNKGQNAFHIAASNPDAKILNAFLGSMSWQVELDLGCDNWALTPLHYAVTAGLEKNVKALLDWGVAKNCAANNAQIEKDFPNLSDKLPLKITPLWLALHYQHFSLLPLLGTYAHIIRTTFDTCGLTFVHLAALYGKKEVLLKLAENFGDKILLDCEDSQKRKPIHVAAGAGQLGIVEFLLQKGAALSCQDTQGNTPLHIAAMFDQKEVVRKICEIAQAQAQTTSRPNNTSYLQALNNHVSYLKNYIGYSSAPININARNFHSETPYMLAASKDHTSALKVLAEFKADTVSVEELFMRTIYLGKELEAKTLQKNQDENEHRIAILMVKYGEKILNMKDAKGNTLLHHCALAFQYCVIKILLHPLTAIQRQNFCELKNRAGKRPIDLLQIFKVSTSTSQPPPKLNSEQCALLGKIERELLKYDVVAWSKMTTSEKASYLYLVNRDFKDDLISSTYYQRLTTASVICLPLYRFASTTLTTGWLAGLFVASSELTGGDAFAKIERLVSYSSPHLPDRLQKPTQYGQQLLNYLSLYRRTTMRITLEVVRRGTTLALNQLHLEQKALASKNYFTHINLLSALLFVNEEAVGRHIIVPHLEKYWVSVEQTLHNQYGVPTINHIIETSWQEVMRRSADLGNLLNNVLHHHTGINAKDKIYKSYTWVKENILRQPTPLMRYDMDVKPHLLSSVIIESEEGKQNFAILGEMLFLKYHNELPLFNEKIEHLRSYVNKGVVNESVVATMQECAGLLTERGLNGATIVASLYFNNFNTAEIGTDALKDIEKTLALDLEKAFKENAKNLFNQFSVGTTNVLVKLRTLHADKIIDKHVMPVLGITEVKNSDFVKRGLRLYMVKHNDNPNLISNVEQFVNFMNGAIPLDQNNAAIIHEIAILMHEEGSNYATTITSLITSSPLYQNLSVDERHDLEQSIEKQINQLTLGGKQGDLIALQNVISNSKSAAADKYAKAFVMKEFLPVVISKDVAFTTLITNVVQPYFVIHFNKGDLAEGDLQAILNFINSGQLTEQSVKALTELEPVIAKQNLTVPEFIAYVVINTPYYQENFSKERREEFRNSLALDLSKIPATDYLQGEKINLAINAAGVKANQVFYEDQVDKQLMPEFKCKSKDACQIIRNGLVDVVSNTGDNDQAANGKLEVLALYVNYGVIGPETFKVIDGVLKVNKNDITSYGAKFSELILNSPQYQNGFLNAHEINHLKNKITKEADAIVQDNNPDDAGQLEALYKKVQKEIAFLHIGRHKSGMEVANDYQKGLRIKRQRPNDAHRADVLSVKLMEQGEYYFTGMTPKEATEARTYLNDYIFATKGKKKNKDERGALNFNTVTTFFFTYNLVPSFMDNEPMELEARKIMASRDAKEVRAGFAVHELEVLINDTPGYYRLTFKQKFDLYRKVIDIQHENIGHGKEENKIKSAMWDTLKNQAIDPNNLPLIQGRFTLDEASDYIVNTSKLAGENNWANTPKDLTRPIHGKEKHFYKKWGKSLQKGFLRFHKNVPQDLQKNVGIGGAIGGGQPPFGMMNLATGHIAPISFTPEQNTPYEFKLTGLPEKGVMPVDNGNMQRDNFIPLTPRNMFNDPYGFIIREANPNVQAQNRPMSAWMDKAWENLADENAEQRNPILYPFIWQSDYSRHTQQEEAKQKPHKLTQAGLRKQGNNEGTSESSQPTLIEAPLPVRVEHNAPQPARRDYWDLVMEYGFGLPAAYGSERSNPEPTKKTRRVRFSLPSEVPAHDDNPYWDHTFAFCRGVEKARDTVADIVVHPIANALEIGEFVWDSTNAITDVAYNISTEGSRVRNTERVKNLKGMAHAFQHGDSVVRTEMLTEVFSTLVFAGSVAGAPRVLLYGGLEKAGRAIKNPYGYAVQSSSAEAKKARKQVANREIPLSRIGTEGKSKPVSKAQFAATGLPHSQSGARNGIPKENLVNLNFGTQVRLKSNEKFVTRHAPGHGPNPGGDIEVVANPGAFEIVESNIHVPPQIMGNRSLLAQWQANSARALMNADRTWGIAIAETQGFDKKRNNDPK